MSLPGTGLAEAGGYWDGKLYLRHRARLGTRVARRGDASGRPFGGVKAKVNTETMRDDFLTGSATGFFSFFFLMQITDHKPEVRRDPRYRLTSASSPRHLSASARIKIRFEPPRW